MSCARARYVTETLLTASADIVWLRDDFRLDDQPSIHATADLPALFVYVHDESGGGARPLGGAAKWRLAKSLAAMEAELSARGARLDIVRGDAEGAILALASAAGASRVLWTRRHEGGAMVLDARVKAALKEHGVDGLSFNGASPWTLPRPTARQSASIPRSGAAIARSVPCPHPRRRRSA